MPKIHPIQTSFASGEISDKLYGRINSDIYKNGLKECTNFNVDIRGSLMARYGSRHQFGFDNESEAKLFPFFRDIDNTALLVFLDERIQIRKILDSAGTQVEHIENRNFSDGGLDWVTAVSLPGTVTFINDTCELDAGGVGKYAQISQAMVVTSGIHRLALFGTDMGGATTGEGLSVKIGTAVDDGTYLDEEINGGSAAVFTDVIVPSGTIYLTIRQLGGALSHKSILDVTSFSDFHSDTNYVTNPQFLTDGSDWSEDDPGAGSIAYPDDTCVMTNGIGGGDYVAIAQAIVLPVIGSYIFALHGSNIGGTGVGNEFEVRIGSAPGLTDIYLNNAISGESFVTDPVTIAVTTVYITLVQLANGTDTNATVLDLVFFGTGEFTQVVLDEPSPYTAAELKHLHFNITPEADAVYITVPTQVPYEVTYDKATDLYDFQVIVFEYNGIAATFPTEWTNSYPATMTFFQGRSWWAGVIDYPDTVWGSESSEYKSLGDGSGGVLPADPLMFSTSRHGLIKWLDGGKNLIVGTEIHEFTVWSGVTSDSTIVPGHVETVRQTSHGSSGVQPVDVGNALVFADTSQKIIRAFWFNWQEDGWISQDLTFAASQITSAEVIEINRTKTPQDMIFCVLDTGIVAVCTYYRDGADQQAQAGWTSYITDGHIRSMCVFAQKSYTQTWIAVERIVEGVPCIHIESAIIGQVRGDFEIPTFKTDSSKQVVYGTPTAYMEGLDHLEGEMVRPVIDNSVHPLVEVISGRIDLQWSGTIIQAGLPYTCTLETLPISVADPLNTTLGHLKRWNKIYVYVYSSVKPLVNGTRPATRFPATPMDETQPDITQILEVNNLGRKQLETIIIEHDLPRDLIILAIFGELGQDSL